MNDATFFLPRDHLIKVSNLDEDGMHLLVRSMESSAAKALPVPSRPRTRARAAIGVDCVEWFVIRKGDTESVMFLHDSSLGELMS